MNAPREQPTDNHRPTPPVTGEMAERIRSLDWSRTPIGPREQWPPCLHTIVNVLVATQFPMALLWGPDSILIYNDAYRAICADKHPAALGSSTREIWSEVWHINQPIVKAVLERGETLHFEDHPFPINRRGYTENAYFTLCYSPVRIEDGSVGGLLVVLQETTARGRSEQALRESEERYRAVVEDQTELICRFKADGTFTFVNEVYCRFFGKTSRELLATRWQPHAVVEDLPLIEAKLPALSATHPVVAIENRVHSGTGEVRWMQFVNRGFFNDQGQLQEIQSVGRDITARKLAEAAHAEVQERLQLILDASNDGLWDWDVRGGLAYLSPRYYEMTGYQPGEVVPDFEFFKRLVHPEDVSRVLQVMTAHLEGRSEDSVLEYRMIAKDGKEKWILGRGKVVQRDSDGTAARMVGTISDITKRKRVEAQLRESELKFSAAFLTSPDLMAITQLADGEIVEINESYSRMLGYTREESLGKTTAELAIWADPRDRSTFLTRLRASGMITDCETKLRRKDGSLVTVSDSARIIAIGNEPFVLSVARDITDRKQAESALRRANIYNRSLIEASLDPLVTIGGNGEITDVNHAIELATGYPRAKLLGTDFCDYFTEPERARTGYLRAFHEGSVRDYPLEIRHREGRTMPVLYNAAVYRDETGNVVGVLAAARDITERKRSEEAMRQLTRRLLEAEEAERRRLARELHDSTAQKIAGLIMSLGRIEDTMGNADEAWRRRLGEAQALAEECARELRTISYLLHPPLLEEMGLELALDTYITGFSQRSGIQVHMDLPPNLGRLSAEQEMTLFRVVQESLGNIHRHSGSGIARVQLTRVADRLILEVQDEGHGIPAERLERIREPAPAFGVGISGMRERLAQIGGLLEIESTAAGTTVRAILILTPHPQ